jgi:Flp pilus assembly protein TadB
VSPALVLVCLGAGFGCAGGVALLVPPTPRLGARLRPYTYTAAHGRGGLDRAVHVRDARSRSAVGAVLGEPARALVAVLGRRLERRSDEALRLALRRAGLRDATPEGYRGRVATAVLVCGAIGGGLGIAVFHSGVATLVLVAGGVVTGVSRTRGRLERAEQARRERIRLELVTVDQLLAMHLRTGAGPVQAVRRIVERGQGAVVEELSDVLDALRQGVPEPDAFRRAAELTPEPAAARSYRLFAAGVERGVDLADGLRALSDDLRDARREEIRKVATRRRAAMLVPTIAVLAPVMLLFIAAPLPSIVFGQR